MTTTPCCVEVGDRLLHEGGAVVTVTEIDLEKCAVRITWMYLDEPGVFYGGYELETLEDNLNTGVLVPYEKDFL